MLAAYDSAGELRLRSELFGGAWVTAFSAAAGERRGRRLLGSWRLRGWWGRGKRQCQSHVLLLAFPCICPARILHSDSTAPPTSAAERKSTEQYWVVSLSARELQCIVCANSPEPAVPSGACCGFPAAAACAPAIRIVSSSLAFGPRGRCHRCVAPLPRSSPAPCSAMPPPRTSAGNQRPVVTAVPLRPPVVAQDAAVAPFEADLIRWAFEQTTTDTCCFWAPPSLAPAASTMVPSAAPAPCPRMPQPHPCPANQHNTMLRLQARRAAEPRDGGGCGRKGCG